MGEASAEEDRRVENKRYSNWHERCACYATARLREGDGAHAPAAPSTCVGEASVEEDRMVENKRYSNGHERCACYATPRLREGDGAHAPTRPLRLPPVWARRQPRKPRRAWE